MSTAAETEDVQISGGYTLEVNQTEHEVSFRATKDGERFSASAIVKMPLPPHNSWQREWDPERDDPEYSRVEFASYGTRRMTPEQTVATSEVLKVSADLCRRLNDLAAEPLAWQEYARRDVVERARREEAEEERKRAEIKESVQWYVGQKFKLRRRGYKATVFGVIDRISDTTLYTTSERGVSMTTQIDDLTELHIMYDGERRYTKVFPV